MGRNAYPNPARLLREICQPLDPAWLLKEPSEIYEHDRDEYFWDLL
jgi:hypothetical protein